MPAPDGPADEEKPQTLMQQVNALTKALQGLPRGSRRIHKDSLENRLGLSVYTTRGGVNDPRFTGWYPQPFNPSSRNSAPSPVPHWYKRLQYDPSGSVFTGNPTLIDELRGAYQGRLDSPQFNPLYQGTPPWHSPPSGDNPATPRSEG
jgi:hypothetical protein